MGRGAASGGALATTAGWRRPLVALAAVLFALPPAVATAQTTPAPPVVHVHRDVIYATDNGQPLRLDAYTPPHRPTPEPMLVLVHGGGWVAGDKNRFAAAALRLAAAGYAVFNIDYGTASRDDPGFPRQVRDVTAAVTWVHGHARDYGGDAGRVGLVGSSAGGYLVAMVGLNQPTASDNGVRAVVSLSGPMDMVALARSLRTPAASCHQVGCENTLGNLAAFLGCRPGSCPATLLAAASPIDHVTASAPAFYLANSTRELVPVSQATSMAARLHDAGVPVHLQLVPGSVHAPGYVPRIAGSIGAFLRQRLTAPPAAATGRDDRRPVRTIAVAVLLVAAAGLVGYEVWRRRRR